MSHSPACDSIFLLLTCLLLLYPSIWPANHLCFNKWCCPVSVDNSFSWSAEWIKDALCIPEVTSVFSAKSVCFLILFYRQWSGLLKCVFHTKSDDQAFIYKSAQSRGKTFTARKKHMHSDMPKAQKNVVCSLLTVFQSNLLNMFHHKLEKWLFI